MNGQAPSGCELYHIFFTLTKGIDNTGNFATRTGYK